MSPQFWGNPVPHENNHIRTLTMNLERKINSYFDHKDSSVSNHWNGKQTGRVEWTLDWTIESLGKADGTIYTIAANYISTEIYT